MKTINNIKPILFSSLMVQAILNGMKTQTRREIKSSSPEMTAIMINILAGCEIEKNKEFLFNHARIEKGDTLWARETWQQTYNDKNDSWDYIFKADGKLWVDDEGIMPWKPSIHMPKKAARIFLKVTDVKIELLQSITEHDAVCEGVDVYGGIKQRKAPTTMFKELWQSINGLESWDLNPLVWVIEFEISSKPENFV